MVPTNRTFNTLREWRRLQASLIMIIAADMETGATTWKKVTGYSGNLSIMAYVVFKLKKVLMIIG